MTIFGTWEQLRNIAVNDYYNDNLNMPISYNGKSSPFELSTYAYNIFYYSSDDIFIFPTVIKRLFPFWCGTDGLCWYKIQF